MYVKRSGRRMIEVDGIFDIHESEGFEKMEVLRDEMAEGGRRVESRRGQPHKERTVQSENGVFFSELRPQPPCQAYSFVHGHNLQRQ